ncbi:MAG: NAD(P)(+) transhydrogenase (Re/Si-specific) subunit beta [Spirochaetaceae bacterium]|nr:NAD(P)(+) transhydrogenase (Re/Si-specific) subunit beta [Spirochaetaceae bacterium]
MREMLINLAYILSAVLFIMGIKRLGKIKTARQGNAVSAFAMLVAVVAIFFDPQVMAAGFIGTFDNVHLWIFVAIILASLIGIVWAKKVAMTGMPEMVAMLNGFGALASFAVGAVDFLRIRATGGETDIITAVSTGLAIFIGAMAFTGSIIATLKLSEKISGKAVMFPGQNGLNALIMLLVAAIIVVYALPVSIVSVEIKTYAIIALMVISAIFGITLVMRIGGGDMPVVISLINSLTGLAVASAGFIILNPALIVTGCLVGASGIILTLIMCKAMNRSISNLLFSGFGANVSSGKANGPQAEPKSMSVEDAYMVMEAAQSVVFIPGYGMAVAQAQHAVKELAAKLEENGAEVNFAIHPVAGRMPGHMNVLLAEADIPYEQLKTMDEINPTMPTYDVAVVIGANDVVNPAAETDTSSPIYGMPIIKAHEARTVFVLKRGKGKGFSGIENELFTRPNTIMIYGDAKGTITGLANEFGAE